MGKGRDVGCSRSHERTCVVAEGLHLLRYILEGKTVTAFVEYSLWKWRSVGVIHIDPEAEGPGFRSCLIRYGTG